MAIRSLIKVLACVAALTLSLIGTAHAVTIDIYIGNNASFASVANNPASNQGFTRIRDRWTNSGATVNITSAFNPAGKDIFLATAPQSAWSAAQVSALHTSQRIDALAEIDGLAGNQHLQLGNELDHARELPSSAPSTKRHTASTNSFSPSPLAVTTVRLPAALSTVRRHLLAPC